MTKINQASYVHPLAPTALNDTLTAERYDAMKHAPRDFQVQLSYLHFKHETLAQYFDILSAGIRPIWDDGRREYHSSADMFEDANHGAICVRHTVWSGDVNDMPLDHPMHETVDAYLPPDPPGVLLPSLMLNDVFRFVHDINGHYGGYDAKHHSFGPNGERAAWQRHRNLYSRTALLALWCETRGQAAWVNAFDDHASMKQSERPFAEQKSGMVPTWLL